MSVELTLLDNVRHCGEPLIIKAGDGEPHFIAADICAVLEIQNPSDAIKRLDSDEHPLVSIEGASNGLPVNAVNESGLYNLILSSRKPEAKVFKRWITHEVLPEIRRTGSYVPLNDERPLPTDYRSALALLLVAEDSRFNRPPFHQKKLFAGET